MKEKPCRQIAKQRSGQRCERCSQYGLTTLHHRKKRGQGGMWDPTNCVMLCGHGTTGCHGWVEHNPNAAEVEGFHVRPWLHPAEVKLLYQGRWALLTDDGKIEYQ